MSKELECLKRIDTKNYLTEREHRDFYSVIEKSLKDLEIIKKKEVSVRLLKSSYTLLEYYTKYKSRTGCNTELTQEEFELLRSVREWADLLDMMRSKSNI